MSQAPSMPSTTASNFQFIFNAALDGYENKTKKKLLTHPLAVQIQSCNSPAEILPVLQGLVQQFDNRRRSDARLTTWLNPTVNVLYALSATLGQGVGLVNLTPISLPNPDSDRYSLGILTCKRNLCWDWGASHGENPLELPSSGHCHTNVC